ncbi:DUF1003 domain-containing protein [Oharaeibacter diazotrophicus]|uniref:Putative membrane protein n=1 Tax=Oharaeibacter diazotrophicus TaxID=1920512 RepID=A0A4R6RAN8_9HYPH|nr:DUF1003 domain-containing protein [Oharaeibacter diazotrophicus]TDP83089.1 putative membrane protein [Oharaeibacter diazotrophicus]BBE71920.1 hypothetical protein OHA_1_01505 [Pleomorphomonas sp. SM30]GLS78683.1 hypothetical protein GCM10007904_40200 [Oharaeibacter diazotrophicus]
MARTTDRRQGRGEREPSILARNIAVLEERRRQTRRTSPLSDRIAAAISAFTGSMTFVALHVVVFGVWILANLGLVPVLPVWDGDFIILGTSASIEAIFLSTFILITQNRMAEEDNRRADLDVQIGLLAEHEISRLAVLVAAIADKLGVEGHVDPDELDEIVTDVAPEQVLDRLERQADGGTSPPAAGSEDR